MTIPSKVVSVFMMLAISWALVFCEVFPDKTNAILKRGYTFGESRVVFNMHWHSDKKIK
jgi:hypothetical protein